VIRHVLITAWLVMFWTAAPAGAAARQDNESVIGMPMVETEAVITDWLEQNDFQVYANPSANQGIVLAAYKTDSRLDIILSPQSPLATRVRFESAQGRNGAVLKDLRNHLQGYIGIPGNAPAFGETEVPDVVRDRLGAVVCLYSRSEGQEIQISGFVIDPEGWILCTAHDLKLSQMLTVLRDDGREAAGRVTRLDSRRDLALVHVSMAFADSVSLRDGRYMLRNGDPLYAVSCPGSGVSGIRPGVLDGSPRRVEGLPLWQVRMHIEPGSSGSPVFDQRGRLAAIVKGRYRGTDSVGFLIPFETLLNFMEKY
jgi:serine protease Do